VVQAHQRPVSPVQQLSRPVRNETIITRVSQERQDTVVVRVDRMETEVHRVSTRGAGEAMY
jgi:hypothetical protein